MRRRATPLTTIRRRLRVQTHDPGKTAVRGSEVLLSEVDEHGVERRLEDAQSLAISVDSRQGLLTAVVTLFRHGNGRRAKVGPDGRHHVGVTHVNRYEDVVLGPAPEGTTKTKEKTMGEFAIVNHSAGRVGDADLRTICTALSQQVEKFAYEWGLLQPVVAFYPPGTEPPPSAWVVEVVDKPDLDGALAYHSVAEGRANAFVFAGYIQDNGGSVLSGPNSVASACSHEVLELLRDPPCTILVEMPLVGPDGRDYVRVAAEVCDPVQGGVDKYEVALNDARVLVSLSAYVLPAWEDPTNLSGPFSSDGTLTRAGEVAEGGYAVFEDAAGREHQVMAKNFPEHLRVLKRLGRSARRVAASLRRHGDPVA